jgi:membrane-associated phospholipid phosphatase
MRNVLFAIAILFIGFSSLAQRPYQFYLKRDLVLTGTVISLSAANYWAKQGFLPLTQGDIIGLEAIQINGIDRFATTLYSEPAIFRSDIGLELGLAAGSGTVLALAGLSSRDSRYSNLLLLLSMYAEANLLVNSGKEFTKHIVNRNRPFVYNTKVGLSEKLDTDARKSFFSGHTSITAVNTFFAAKVFSDFYPNSKYRPYVWALAALIPAWTGAERVLAGKHFPTDVVAGYVFGAMVGYFVPHIHKLEKEKTSMEILPFSNPMGCGLQLVVNL